MISFEIVAFALIATFAVIFAALVFVAKKFVHAVLALTAVFAISALLFILLGQVLVGILQLFLFVGGLALYLIVTLAAEYRQAEHTRLAYVPIIAAVVAIVMLLPLASIFYGSQQGGSFASVAASDITDYYAALYFMLIMLFGIAIGSIALIKKFVKLVV